MSENIPPDDLDSTRAALEPTLRAVAEILPLVVEARQPRFPPELSRRWQDCCHRIARFWSERHCGGLTDFRPAVFELCAIAIELNDGDCLQLSEALASASDLLEDHRRSEEARLLAAISATCECLVIEHGIEHPLFSERARHMIGRLQDSLQAVENNAPLALAIVASFLGEAREQVDAMHEALQLLPPDAYAIKTAAEAIVRLAKPLEHFNVIDCARLLIFRLTPRAGEDLDLDDPETRAHVLDRIALLESALAEIAETS